MGLINLPKANQTPNKGGCLRRIIVIAVVAFVAYYLMKSCGGGGVIDLGGRGNSHEESTTTPTDNNTITMPDMTPNSTTSSSNSGDYSWIVGTWSCEMGAYGTVVMRFEGDGTSGDCSERQPDGSYRYGTYQVNGDVLSYQLKGESIPKKISIQPSQKLLDESGSYYRKK